MESHCTTQESILGTILKWMGCLLIGILSAGLAYIFVTTVRETLTNKSPLTILKFILSLPLKIVMVILNDIKSIALVFTKLIR